MSVHIAILVEGATETALKAAWQAFLKTRLAGRMPRLDFVQQDGRLPKDAKLRRLVEFLLADHDAVIALTDVYTGTQPPDFADAADAKRTMRNWVGPEPHFYPHAAQHDFEAWLIPFWPDIQKLAGSTRSSPSQAPETINHNRPPSQHLKDLFRTGTRGRSYVKTRDAMKILRDQDLAVAAARCPELQSFLDTILRVAEPDGP